MYDLLVAIKVWYIKMYMIIGNGFMADFNREPISTTLVAVAIGGAIICFVVFVISGLLYNSKRIRGKA